MIPLQWSGVAELLIISVTLLAVVVPVYAVSVMLYDDFVDSRTVGPEVAASEENGAP